ncbi:3-deoxy-D-manno-octulosonic acid transferase [Algirhabdus cladophorae]|uniref:3-deoxy-D-manno-octulosonic acid transferase n=1 Tax=Algirhabdus cladophorae TaxID=3377108 RepID=UPI003B84ABEB
MRRPLALRLYLSMTAASSATGQRWAAPLDLARPEGPLVWIHSEAEACQDTAACFAKHLQKQRDDIAVLLTTCDPVAPRKDAILYDQIPPETQQDTAAFLQFWRPDLGIWMHSGLRPVLLDTATQNGIDLVLANATEALTLSTVARNYRGVRRAILRQFKLILCLNNAAKLTLAKLTADTVPIEETGPLQLAPPVLDCDETLLEEYRTLVQNRPIWLAANTRFDDEATLVLAHRQAIRTHHRLLMVLHPEDPSKGDEIAQTLGSTGWSIAQLSKGQIPREDVQILIADVPGQLGMWYRLAPISFLGGTLAKQPAADPFQAASLGSAVLHGPRTAPFENAYTLLSDTGAGRLIRTPEQLLTALNDLLQAQVAASMARAAWEVTSHGATATDRLISVIETTFDDMGY